VQEPAPAKAGDIDERVNAFLERPIEGEWRHLWRDATCLKVRDKVRDGGRIVSVAAIKAMAVATWQRCRVCMGCAAP
jgi:putative transposase